MNKFDIIGICGNGASYDILVEAGDFLTAFSSVAATFNNIGPGLVKLDRLVIFQCIRGLTPFYYLLE